MPFMAVDHKYRLKSQRVINSVSIEGVLDLGFNFFKKCRITLCGVAPSEDPATRKEAKKRLRELLKEGQSHPDGLFVKTFYEGEGRPLLGEILYVYARDLHNADPNSQPWVGWSSVNSQLASENLVNRSS